MVSKAGALPCFADLYRAVCKGSFCLRALPATHVHRVCGCHLCCNAGHPVKLMADTALHHQQQAGTAMCNPKPHELGRVMVSIRAYQTPHCCSCWFGLLMYICTAGSFTCKAGYQPAVGEQQRCVAQSCREGTLQVRVHYPSRIDLTASDSLAVKAAVRGCLDMCCPPRASSRKPWGPECELGTTLAGPVLPLCPGGQAWDWLSSCCLRLTKL